MDRDVIEKKLESLRRCLKRIEAKCPAALGWRAGTPLREGIARAYATAPFNS